ncbi:SDR family oxidoreductase [Kordiimonas pumila]|uniref:SDR family oxidoreductase n=1 Tax=Kordiimonas pumila TaxID=2161677 RepID=A0ABV7D898_9PROT|nr:SDR family oxidoreductase [Kordiimonas pumila]
MFENKVVWITGASSGIGEAVAYEMAKAGAVLILSARREDVLAHVSAQCARFGVSESNIKLLPFDITDEAVFADITTAAHSFKGRIDMLFNNAGISQRSLCVDTDMATYRRLFEVDVFGQIALTKQVLPHMLEQGAGHIAVTASVAGKIGVAERTGYCAAKHAVMGFFDALRSEVNRQGIHVTTITPGFIRTAISENALKGDGEKFGKMDKNISGGMDVTACAEAIMKGFKRGKKEIAVGTGKEMQGLWVKRFFPNLLFKITGNLAPTVTES